MEKYWDMDKSKVIADDLDLIAFRFLKTSGNVWFFTLNAQVWISICN